MADILSFLKTCSAQKINQDSKRRLQKHVQSELSYLSRATSGAGAESASVSSNLNHLEAIVSLLKLPAISCVVGILQAISIQNQRPSAAAPSLSDKTELCTTAVDLVCLFNGEPAWIIVSARNPHFVSWENPGDERTPSYPLHCPHGPSESAIACAGTVTSPETSPSTLRVSSKRVEVLPEPLSANPLSRTRRLRPTHDTCLKDRIAGLLDAAARSSQLHRPSKIVLCFARGLHASLQTLLSETFGAVACPLMKPLGFEILVNTDPQQERTTQSFQSGAQLLASPALDPRGKRLSAKQAPDSEALAWSLVERLPSPTSPVHPKASSGDMIKGADGVSKEWIVLEDPCIAPDQSPCEKDGSASASRREEGNSARVAVSGGSSPNGSRVRGRVMDAVRRLENEGERSKEGRCAGAEQRTEHGRLEAAQMAPALEGSFVAVDGPEGSFDSGDSVAQETMVSELDAGTTSPAALQNGWVAVRLGDDALHLQSSGANGSLIPETGSSGEEKEWFALSSAAELRSEALIGSEFTGGSGGDEKGGQWVGVQQSELRTEALGAVPGDWIGVSRSVTESEQNGIPERPDRTGIRKNGIKGIKGDPNAGLEEMKGEEAQGKTGRKGDKKDKLEHGKAEQNGDQGNGTERNGFSERTAAPQSEKAPAGRCANSGTRGTDILSTQPEKHGENGSGLAEGRFRTLNQVPLSERPASWPAGLELVNLDTTALVALVSGITNGAAEALRAIPEQAFRERWKGNAGFMRDQLEAESQYPQLPYLESVTADKALLVTQHVLQEFVSIVSVVGSDEERARADRFLKRCWLIADSPSDRLRSLPPSRAIKACHVAIFGTADAWACPTLTSNAAFARAVQKQGVPLWVLEHRPSALVGC